MKAGTNMREVTNERTLQGSGGYREDISNEEKHQENVFLWLQYIRDTGCFNMVAEYDNARIHALVCGVYCGYFHENITDLVKLSEPPEQHWLKWTKWCRDNPNAAQALPYSDLYAKKCLQIDGKTSKISRAKRLVEKAKKTTLMVARFARDEVGIKCAQTTDEYELLCIGVQLMPSSCSNIEKQ